jgi:selenophosphate synthase
MARAVSDRKLDRWKIPPGEIEKELQAGKRTREMVCLGCAAKIPLVEVVYPVLHEIRQELSGFPQIKFEPREDSYFFETDGGPVEIYRGVYSVQRLVEGRAEEIENVRADVDRFDPTGVVLLVSLTASPSKEAFKKAMTSFLKAASAGVKPGKSLSIGKGHSIQISKTPADSYFVADYIRAKKGKFYGVANNDTISTIDPNLKHSSWISVFVGLNNALNDLFVEGVYKNIEIYPTFDTRLPDEEAEIKKALRLYEERYRDMGIRIHDAPKIGFNTQSNGATVYGVTDKEGARNENLQEGDILIATRPIGDLAPLTEYLIRESLEESTGDIEEIRKKVLAWMLLPNFEAAKILARHLPAKGEPHDPERHISSARDMTGPGILAVEELAQDSGVDIYLHNLVLFADWIGNVEMPNPTSGTNGAIIVAGRRKVAKKVYGELERAGYEPWIIGEVLRKSRDPKILIRQSLKRHRFLVGMKKGIFENYVFVPPGEVRL